MNDFALSDIQNLVRLLNLEDNNSSDEEVDCNSYSSPATIACSSEKCVGDKKQRIDSYAKYEVSKHIWSEDEVLDEEYDETVLKVKPDYELIYQQSVTPDDIFLQLNDKGPGTDSCESMMIKVQLEEIESSKDISLKISENKFLCKTKKHYLNLDLPKRVDPGKCSAKWDQLDCILNVMLYLEEDSLLKSEFT